MKFDLCDGGEDGEHIGVGFVAISEIFVVQVAFIFGIISFDRVYRRACIMLPHQKSGL